jgi:hypothetical protein
MIYIVYTVLLFNLLIIIFKFFEKFKVDNLQALIFNYFTAAVCGYLFSDKSISFSTIINAQWIYHAMILGFLFIVIFNFYAFGTQKVGIAVSTVANKMSLIIPVSVVLIMDPGDHLTVLKTIGFVLALIGIYLASTNNGQLSFNKKYLWLILLIFIGQGISDSIFNNSKDYLKQGEDMQFFITLFTMAGLSGLLILAGKSVSSFPKLEIKNLIWGIIFGIPNFFSLFYFLEALKLFKATDNTSIVFPLVSMGVVISSAIIGILFYKENLSKGNWLGILFALASIAVFSF